MKIVFSTSAKADIREALRYTRARFGASQVRVYRARISAARKRLQENPGIGHHRDGLPPEGRLLHISEPSKPACHFFLYRVDVASKTIFVVRFIHDAMNIPAHWHPMSG